VTLYTFPLIAIHASFLRRCFFNSDGGIRKRDGVFVCYSSTLVGGRARTRRSFPEDLRRAQSSGEWPGARMTFCRGRRVGGSVDIDGASDEIEVAPGRTVEVGGGINKDEETSF